MRGCVTYGVVQDYGLIRIDPIHGVPEKETKKSFAHRNFVIGIATESRSIHQIDCSKEMPNCDALKRG